MSVLARLLEKWRTAKIPQSLFTIRRPRPRDLDRLYLVRVDFELTPERACDLRASLGQFGETHGIDFLVLEPGIHLEKFNEV